MEHRWVTNLSEDRKRFYLVSSLLDPRTKMLSFCDNKYFPYFWKDDALGDISLPMSFF
jgi:type II restriction/modification system DNA methylase subunit YeeA